MNMKRLFFYTLYNYISINISTHSSNFDDTILCSPIYSDQTLQAILNIYKPSLQAKEHLDRSTHPYGNKTVLIFVDLRRDIITSSFNLEYKHNTSQDVESDDKTKQLQTNSPADMKVNYKSRNVYIIIADELPEEAKQKILDNVLPAYQLRNPAESIATILLNHLTKEKVREGIKTYSLNIDHTHKFLKKNTIQENEGRRIDIGMRLLYTNTNAPLDVINLFKELTFNMHFIVHYNNKSCSISSLNIKGVVIENPERKQWHKINAKILNTYNITQIKLLNEIIKIYGNHYNENDRKFNTNSNLEIIKYDEFKHNKRNLKKSNHSNISCDEEVYRDFRNSFNELENNTSETESKRARFEIDDLIKYSIYQNNL